MNNRVLRGIIAASLTLCGAIAASASDDAAAPQLSVPSGFVVEVAAAPPLVQHPTFATFDDQGRLFVCENAGVNLSAEELEQQLPNSIRLLVDRDGDGHFDDSTLFADQMTFPMGGAWHEGALYVASPPHIWRLEDTNDDGVADRREKLVGTFGYTGNGASIHGCVLGPDGRLYWCDGYHGHEFRDAAGNITSKREGSYIFSCRADGSDVRLHCGGGMDNPVEVDFTTEGEMLGTVNILYTRPREDCLVHWLYGGVYPHRERVLGEVKTTGDVLGPVHRFGHVAVSGTLRYRSGALDPAWRDSFFATFFNSGKVVRVQLQRDGASYKAVQREFLASASRDFHPTDIVEDADGSLLVVDTGGWFYRGCPTSQFAKPDVLGAIYRVRRADAIAEQDPRGRTIAWDTLNDVQLGERLQDARFAVRERAVAAIARRGAAGLPMLEKVLAEGEVLQRQNALWALVRIVSTASAPPQAAALLRRGLEDPELAVRLVACRGIATYPDPVAGEPLVRLLRGGQPPERREAAKALGRIGDARAVDELLRALDGPTDRTEQHAVIYALIELNDPEATRAGLSADAPAVQHGALVALDQMDGGDLKPHDVLPLVATDDAHLQNAAAKVFSRHPDWAPHAAEMIAQLLAEPERIEQRALALRRLAPQFLSEPAVGEVVGRVLSDERLPMATRNFMLDLIASGQGVSLHASWVQPMETALAAGDPAQLARALAAVAALKTGRFKPRLEEIASNTELPVLLRVRALGIAAGSGGALSEKAFGLLLDAVEKPSNDGLEAAQQLGSAALSKPQLLRLAPLLADAAPSQLAELLRPFERTSDAEVAEAVVAAMEDARGLASLPPHRFSDVILHWPAELLPAGNRLLDRIRQHDQERLARLDSLLPLIGSGNATRGREVFFSEKAKCSTCHRVGQQGAAIGPDLTTIGANRTGRDLLESIVLPSATLVRDYEPYTVVTIDGRVFNGLVTRETRDTLYLQQQLGEPIAIAREQIEQMAPSTVSIMPNGLEQALSEAELADVIAYLLHLTTPATGPTAMP